MRLQVVVGKDGQESGLGHAEFEMPIRPLWLMLSRKRDICNSGLLRSLDCRYQIGSGWYLSGI